LRLPSVLLNNAEITYSDKGDEEAMLTNFSEKKLRRKTFVKAKIDWETFDKNFKESSFQDLVIQILGTKINDGTKAQILKKQTVSKRDFCIQIMSLPEYQLC